VSYIIQKIYKCSFDCRSGLSGELQLILLACNIFQKAKATENIYNLTELKIYICLCWIVFSSKKLLQVNSHILTRYTREVSKKGTDILLIFLSNVYAREKQNKVGKKAR